MSDSSRIDLACRRLQIALARADYAFDGETLEAVVQRVAQIVEDRGERDDFLPNCDNVGRRDHWWTEWEINPLGKPREERFCFRCGAMETQELLP